MSIEIKKNVMDEEVASIETDMVGRELHLSFEEHDREKNLRLQIVDLEEKFDVGVTVDMMDLNKALKEMLMKNLMKEGK